MEVEVRPIASEEFEAFAHASAAAFGVRFDAEELERYRIECEPGKSLAAFERGSIVGTAAGVAFELTVPGSFVPSLAVTSVGVLPTHRRRGVLTSLMRKQLDDAREANTPVAILWASEAAIYGRFGYGMATLVGALEIDRRHTGFAIPFSPSGRMRLVERDEALKTFPVVYEHVRAEVPGMISRSDDWWDYRLWIEPHHRGEFGPEFTFALYEDDQGPQAYAAYRVKHQWPDNTPSGILEIEELMATTPEAYAAVWRYCFDVDLMGTIQAEGRPLEEPLQHLLSEPRRLRFRLADGMWARLVDLPAALETRRYPVEGRVILQVEDEFCPWNAGVYKLEGGPDGAECRPSKAEPDLVLSAADLGAAYLGGARLTTLAWAGRIAERAPGALDTATAMFGWTQGPWCPHTF